MTDSLEQIRQRIGGPDLLQWHRQNGRQTTVQAYVNLYQAQVARGLERTKTVYLDTNYWVLLRETVLQNRDVAVARALLARLRDLVAARKIICVSQLTSVLEIAKQNAQSSRVTVGLVDELTEGLSLKSNAELDALEIGRYLRHKAGLTVAPINPWTCIGQIFRSDSGNEGMLPNDVSEAAHDAIWKCAVDAFWNSQLSDMFGAFNWDTRTKLSPDLDAAVIEQVKTLKQTRPHNGNFRKTCVSEFGNATAMIKAFRSDFEQLLTMNASSIDSSRLAAATHGAFRSACSDYASGALGLHLAGHVIRVELYSLYECDGTSRQLTTNDWQDWQHASAALPYCDLFLTEKHLAHQLKNLLRAQERYGCGVVGPDAGEALDAVNALLAG
jgi:hypothetical protein